MHMTDSRLSNTALALKKYRDLLLTRSQGKMLSINARSNVCGAWIRDQV